MKGKDRLRVQERNSQAIHDTYLNKSQPKDRSYCKKCHAIYHNKRWYFDPQEVEFLASQSKEKSIVCPACQKIADRFASGIVTVRGSFYKEHKEEIVNLIRNEETRAKGLNPLARIIEMNPNGEQLEILTTHEKLAQRIGNRLHKSFQGKVNYSWVPQDKMARVSWSR